MKYVLLTLSLMSILIIPAKASEIVAPTIPNDAAELIQSEDIGLAERLHYLFREGFYRAQPAVAPTAKLCGYVLCLMILLALLYQIKGECGRLVDLAGVFAISTLLLDNTASMIRLGVDTVQQVSDYSKLLLPVMTAALAAQGGSASAAALYSATALFDAVVSSVICSVLLPMISVFLVLSAVAAATGDDFLQRLRDLMKQIMTWSLKIMLYVFTGYISITGIISGTADQMAIKVAKLGISGMVPVVGGILSDASETILVSAGIVKNATGIYGILAILAMTVVPFLTVGIHYLLLKVTTMIGAAFSPKSLMALLTDFTAAMGFILAMTGSVCLIQLISMVCFLRGMT